MRVVYWFHQNERIVIMKKKDAHKLEYTPEKLEGILKQATKKVESGQADTTDFLLGSAAAYALDFYHISKRTRAKLDLTGRTEKNVVGTLITACALNQSNKMNAEENRADLVKKFASYQLFAIANSFNYDKKELEIVALSGFVPKPRLVLRSLPDKTGKTYTFDIFGAAEKMMAQIHISDETEGDRPILFGSLKPFYDWLNEDLLCHLSEE